MIEHAAVDPVVKLSSCLYVKAAMILLKLNTPIFTFLCHSFESLHILAIFFECIQLLCFELARLFQLDHDALIDLI